MATITDIARIVDTRTTTTALALGGMQVTTGHPGGISAVIERSTAEGALTLHVTQLDGEEGWTVDAAYKGSFPLVVERRGRALPAHAPDHRRRADRAARRSGGRTVRAAADIRAAALSGASRLATIEQARTAAADHTIQRNTEWEYALDWAGTLNPIELAAAVKLRIPGDAGLAVEQDDTNKDRRIVASSMTTHALRERRADFTRMR
jgi:hypothetical protein